MPRPSPLPPWCGQCSEIGRLVDLPNGFAGRCPRCHPATQPGARHDPVRARRKSARTRLGLTQPECPLCGKRIYKSHHCMSSVYSTITGKDGRPLRESRPL